jgi:hypothetical protein
MQKVREGLVTFRDPGKTSLKTSFQEFIPVRTATRQFSPPRLGYGSSLLFKP